MLAEAEGVGVPIGVLLSTGASLEGWTASELVSWAASEVVCWAASEVVAAGGYGCQSTNFGHFLAMFTYVDLSDGDGETELRAETDTESDSVLTLRGTVALGASTDGKVSLEIRAEGVLAEAVVHIGLLALQRRVVGDHLSEAVDLLFGFRVSSSIASFLLELATAIPRW